MFGEARAGREGNIACCMNFNVHDVGAGVAEAGDDEYSGDKGAHRMLGLSRAGGGAPVHALPTYTPPAHAPSTLCPHFRPSRATALHI